MLRAFREAVAFLSRSRSAVTNASQVFLNKAINALVPFFLIPYLNRVFGVEKFGELVFVQAVATLLIYITDYGFGVTATREVSVHAGDRHRLAELVSSVLLIKLLLTTFVLVGLLVVTIGIGLPPKAVLLYCLTFGAMALQNFMPSWFFQGMRKNAVITIANLASKLLLVGLLFVLVREGVELWLVPLADTIAYLVFLLVGLYLIFGAYRLAFVFPSLKVLRINFFLSLDNFLISVLIWVTTGGLLLVTEAFVPASDFGYFGTFTRIVYYVFAVIQPISLAVFPYVADWQSRDPVKAGKLLSVLTKSFVGAVAVLLLLSLLLGRWFFACFFDEQFNAKVAEFMPAYYGLMLWVALVLVTGFIGTQYFVSRRRDHLYRRFYVISSAVAVVLCVALLPHLGILATSVAMSLGELILLLLLLRGASGLGKEVRA